MTSIFISYDRDNKPFIQELAGKLRRVYDEVWFDQDLLGGQNWADEIRRQIERADIFMFMLSAESVQSQYCKLEFDEAQKLKKPILPVKINTVEPPGFLHEYQYVDMSTGNITADNVTELTAALNRIVDRMTRALRAQQDVLLKQRRRSVRVRWIALAILLAVLLGAVGLVRAQLPSFEGEIGYVSRDGTNLQGRLLQGGLNGLSRNLLQDNPRTLPNVFLTDGTPFAISPDGAQVAFVSSRIGGDAEIYVMDLDGSNLRQLTDNRFDDNSPSWSPDGRLIVFTSNRERNWQLYTLAVDNPATVVNLTNNRDRDEKYPSWSPDGSLIAFSGRDRSGAEANWDIFIIGADGTAVTNLTNNPADDQFPSWSPNGQRLVFESTRGSPASTAPAAQFSILSPRAEIAATPIPGQSLLEDNCTCDVPNTNRDIFITDLSGISLTWLIQSPNIDDRYPTFSPDGNYVVFSSDRAGDLDIYIVDVRGDGRELVLLTDDGIEADDFFPVWFR
jgi:Tol biopolymer transport system component